VWGDELVTEKGVLVTGNVTGSCSGDELVTEKGVLVTGDVTGSCGATNW